MKEELKQIKKRIKAGDVVRIYQRIKEGDKEKFRCLKE